MEEVLEQIIKESSASKYLHIKQAAVAARGNVLSCI